MCRTIDATRWTMKKIKPPVAFHRLTHPGHLAEHEDAVSPSLELRQHAV